MPFKDPQRKREYQKRWIAENAERHRELSKLAMRRWLARHPQEHRRRTDAYTKAHPERRRAWERSYREHHPDARRAHGQARRARAAGASGSHTTEEWLALVAAHGSRCGYCGGSAPLQRDHRVPLARGGSHGIDNIIPACASCNARKGALTEDEFRARIAVELAEVESALLHVFSRYT